MPHNTATPVTTSGNVLIDSLLLGSEWVESTISFAFPQSSSAYNGGLPGYPGGDWHLQNFQAFSEEWAEHARAMLVEVSTFTQLTFVEGDAETSTLRWGRFDDPGNGAFAYGPDSFEHGGDQWFANNNNPDPVIGNGVSHVIRHELGHALGLSHPHDGPYGPMPLDFDSAEYSAMSYRAHTSEQPGDFQGFHFEQSFMTLDIAALQYMYGANFAYNALDTTYAFDPATGRMSINGVAGATPSHPVVLRAIWDGGGVDTYDFSAFDGDQTISLAPGAWSILDAGMLGVLLQRGTPGSLVPIYAAGNIANALLYQDDTRSLIENALGGAGHDTIIGNAANNTLTGNAGNDTLNGDDGSDTLDGGAGADTLDGDGANDIASYASAAIGVVVDLANTSLNTGDAMGDVYVEIETFVGSTHNDTLRGASGADTLLGENGHDVLDGRGGNDTLDGGDGNDVLRGGFGNDAMTGGLGDDYYYHEHAGDTITELSGQGTDTVETALANYVMLAHTENVILSGSANINATGTTAANVMTGNSGSNTLIGGLGNDVLSGLGGKDLLTGGGGLDRFVFTSLSDSAVAFAGREAINTFAHGDKIDLSAIDANTTIAGDQAFTWAPGGFTGVAGQLYVQQNAARSWTVWADVNGDGAADFALNIYGAPALNNGIFAWDFIL